MANTVLVRQTRPPEWPCFARSCMRTGMWRRHTLRSRVGPRCEPRARLSLLLCLAGPPPQGDVHQGAEENQEPNLHGNKEASQHSAVLIKRSNAAVSLKVAESRSIDLKYAHLRPSTRCAEMVQDHCRQCASSMRMVAKLLSTPNNRIQASRFSRNTYQQPIVAALRVSLQGSGTGLQAEVGVKAHQGDGLPGPLGDAALQLELVPQRRRRQRHARRVGQVVLGVVVHAAVVQRPVLVLHLQQIQGIASAFNYRNIICDVCHYDPWCAVWPSSCQCVVIM